MTLLSLYEYAHYDLRQQIDYVLNHTGHESLFYVGHSQGTTVMFARLAESDATWQAKIRIFFAMGPTAGFVTPLMPLALLEEKHLQLLIQFVLDGKFGIIPVQLPTAITSSLADFCSSEFLNHICMAGFKIAAGTEQLGQFNAVSFLVKSHRKVFFSSPGFQLFSAISHPRLPP